MSNKVRYLKTCKQGAFDREKKKLALDMQLARIGEQLQHLGAVAARLDRRGVRSGGEARDGIVVSDGLEARGATVRFWSGTGTEDQHKQSPMGRCTDSRAAKQMPMRRGRHHKDIWPRT